MNNFNNKTIIFLLLIGLSSLIGCDTVSENALENGELTTAEIDPHAGHNHGTNEAHDTGSDESLADWCLEHAVPESVCTQCNPALISSFKESGDWCGGHDIPESHCRLCNPEITFPQEEIFLKNNFNTEDSEIVVSLNFRSNAKLCATNDALIQFASTKTAQKAGISIEQVRESNYINNISAPAETVFDESRLVYVTSTVKAIVTKWMKSPGELVEKGEILAHVKSPEIAQLKASLISKYASYKVHSKELMRYKKMIENNLISQADYDYQVAITEQAKAEMESLEGLLLAAGLQFDDIEDVKLNGTIDNNIDLLAPSSGVLVQRSAQLGELLEAGRTFGVLADPQKMWINAELSEYQIRNVMKGQKLVFSSDGKGLNNVGGEIIWISQFLDPHSRTGTVRAKVLDPLHKLQANEFGRVNILIDNKQNVTLVSKDAVQWEGCCNVVFVKESDMRYRPRKVELLDGDGPYYQVINGLKKGEEIVVSGSFLLKTELKKTSIGAGCCGIEPAS